MKYKKRQAFTMAEVLITIGIIGVVVAMTLPVLITEYQKKVTVSKLKKSYAELNNAISLSSAKNGNPSGWNYYGANDLEVWVKTYIAPFVNNSKVIACPTAGNSVCDGVVAMHSLSYNVASNNANARSGGIMLKSGENIIWRFYRYTGVYEPVTRIYIYANVPKNKPKSFAYAGKDVFMFILDSREASPIVRPYENPSGYYGKKNFTYNVSREKLLGHTGSNYWGGCYKEASGSGYYLPGDACSAVIMKDNWEIKKDYPWR